MVEPWKLFGRFGNSLFQGAYLYAQMKEGKIPDIYVQDYRYFDKYKKEIQHWFGEGIGSIDCVAIHVRRGDYVTTHKDFYVDLSATDYYERATSLFPNKTFIVFSDDSLFCQTLDVFRGENYVIVEDQTELEAFNQMASCTSIITANSSFSWWAAYLNRNSGKTVVAPSVKNWFIDGVERCICPPKWLRI